MPQTSFEQSSDVALGLMNKAHDRAGNHVVMANSYIFISLLNELSEKGTNLENRLENTPLPLNQSMHSCFSMAKYISNEGSNNKVHHEVRHPFDTKSQVYIYSCLMTN